MEELLKKLEENKYRLFKIIDREQLEIIAPEDLELAQEGFRVYPDEHEPIEEWANVVGENVYVIGSTCDLGDPIIVDTDDKRLPVYTLFIDDWNIISRVANSFDEFIENLKMLDDKINKEKVSKEELTQIVNHLDNINSSAGFYEGLCFDILDDSGFYADKYNK